MVHRRPAAQPQRHVREVGAQGGGIATIAEQLPKLELIVVAEAALGAAVEQRDQVEAGIADPRALTVDDAGDAVALGQHVQMVEVEVRDAGDRQGGRVGGLPDRDHAVEQRSAGRRVQPKRSVQAVAVGAADKRPAQEGAPPTPVGPLLLLQPVQLDQLLDVDGQQRHRRAAGEQLLEHEQQRLRGRGQQLTRRRVAADAQPLHERHDPLDVIQRVRFAARHLPPLQAATGCPRASATIVAWLASPSGIAATTRRPQPCCAIERE